MNKPIDISQCDSEPIRFINALQTFGALIILDQDSTVKCYSENLFEYTETSPHDLLDKKLDLTIFPEQKFSLTKSLKDGLQFIQIEKLDLKESISLNPLLEKMQSSDSLKGLLTNVADSISEVTGFDRVMIYKFHEDFHGEVVAEKVKPGIESFYGLHYPASDIPTPARAIFLENWVRMIPDVHYSMVPLKSSLPQIVDLGQILLRAVSPIHVDYLKNMGVGATLTISIVVDNMLWGLIACHHMNPTQISKDKRNKCETIGRFASSLINTVSLKERNHHAENIKKIHSEIFSRLKTTNNISKELVAQSPTLLDLIEAKGASAALYIDGYWVSQGDTPTNAELNQLIDWMLVEHKDKAVWHTNKLSKEFSKAESYKEIASGMLAVSVPKTVRNYIFWFRPEIIQSVKWAGNPDKVVDQVNGRLSPRSSFEEWKEAVHGESIPWKEWEIDAALDLRNAIMALDLKKQFEKEQKARQEAERAKQTREELMEVVSHDLKNPLSSIQMNVHLLKKFIPASEEKNLNLVERILRSSTTMDNLINDILSIAKLQSGTMDLSKTHECVTKVIRESLEMLAPMASEKNITLLDETIGSKTCKLDYDYDRLLQVLSNLIGNAIKFTPEHGKITVTLEFCGPDFIKICITDTGPGIPEENLVNVFDRYWQAHQTSRLGTGLGLSIAKGIVESHGGEIWAESVFGQGAAFHFTLPVNIKE